MKKCINLSIGTTTIAKKPDTDPDTSYLGEYGNVLKPGCIVRKDNTFFEDIPDEWNTTEIKEAHYMHDREYPYFYPPDNGETPGTEDYKRYALQDYQNVEDLNSSQWTYAGIIVKTVIKTDMGISDTIQNSLWGIEDHFDEDSKSEMARIIEDLKEDNKSELLKMGFSEAEIDQSLNTAEIKEEW
ncbi:MAG: hypothetical protein M0Q91_17940 [Methanoregula sp.]|jgi:hypothetical protein|nr:hypothetical protein [Methanoregula sp.]